MAVPDIVLDTNVLADFLGQYFGPAERGRNEFHEGCWLSLEAARRTTQICRWYEVDQTPTCLVVASSFAFVEIAQHWNALARDRFQPHQLAAFLRQPPGWFSVAPVDEDLVEFFCCVPSDVWMQDGSARPIEWTDAVHIATLLSRDSTCLFATVDRRLRRLPYLSQRLL